MKKFIVFLCMFLAVMTLYARGLQDDYRNAEEKTRVSYAIGMIIGLNFDLASLGLEYDYKAIADGLQAVVEDNNIQFTNQEAIEIVETALYRVMERVAEENRLEEESFLISNSMREGIQSTSSGLQYEIILETEGEKPLASSVVRVHYEGYFTNGRLFDSSYEIDGAFIPLDMVIPGWTEGVMMMSVGSIYRFYIPSHLGYGRDGIQGVIPPYSSLIFDVELLEIFDEDFDPYSYFYDYYDFDW